MNIRHQHRLIIAASSIVMLGIFLFTHPFQDGPIVILSLLVAVFVFTLGLTMEVLKQITTKMPEQSTTSLGKTYTSISIATGVVCLIGLHTIGQLQLIDVILVIILQVLINFYIYRRL